ncbi:tyrosine-type recombinase/integrase [Ensifer adhaerens]|uniref:tyrosine-type recombinase/integrase n=1 Tax=Ensifer adhaerens TaxID=106592 RepID=UPI001F1EEFCB|nr:tyrosine-type recombinase/integrase [Ensifer adhaerens]
MPRGYCTTNVIQHTEKIPGGEPWVPWPSWSFEILLEHAPFHMQMIAMSAFFTGQRQGDVLAMTKPKAAENTIAVKAQKAGKTVWIPVHFAYRKWIDRVPQSDSVMLHAGARALSYKSADGFRTEWQKLMKKDEFKKFREERIVFHGLRKNAVINLLEVGCTENQVGAICNMSAQMVQHYGREVALRSLAKDAMKLMEARWSEIEPAAFRNKNGT